MSGEIRFVVPRGTKLVSSIASALSDSLTIVHALHETYPERHHTLDGRLVGEIGETLAEETYEITLYDRTFNEICNGPGKTVKPVRRIPFRVGRKK